LISFNFNNLQLKKTGFFEFLTAPEAGGILIINQEHRRCGKSQLKNEAGEDNP
jgi:hypothetical protein